MYMKKIGLWLISALFVVCACFGITACKDDPPKTYKVAFVGESISVATQTIKKGECAIEPKDPVREGYEFDGWFLDGKLYVFSTPVTKNITLTGSVLTA